MMTRNSPELTTLSLGWGVQSWTLAAMSALGELPKVDYAVHSDTGWERAGTYQFAEQWTPWLEEHGVKVRTVNDHGQSSKVGTKHSDIPAFTLDIHGTQGQLRRQCTGRWKIVPMRRFLRRQMSQLGIKVLPGVVESWLGITTDEWKRAKDSDVAYVKHVFPLLDLGMSRSDCSAWLVDHGLPSPGKSACTFCPYHNPSHWRDMAQAQGPDWEQAIRIDEQIRDKRPPYHLFVHSSRKPLDQAVQVSEYDQLSFLEDDDESCDSGYCFL